MTAPSLTDEIDLTCESLPALAASADFVFPIAAIFRASASEGMVSTNDPNDGEDNLEG